MGSTILLILSLIMVVLAIIGSFVPVIPGPVLGYVALWIAQCSDAVDFSSTFLLVLGIVGIVVFVSDYILPSLITKRFGGSTQASWGAFIGSILGLFLTPIGMILGMLLGAFIGQMISSEGNTSGSLSAAFGAFLGFLVGTGIKMIYCFYILWAILSQAFLD